jgi:hypothetical protein
MSLAASLRAFWAQPLPDKIPTLAGLTPATAAASGAACAVIAANLGGDPVASALVGAMAGGTGYLLGLAGLAFVDLVRFSRENQAAAAQPPSAPVDTFGS